LDVTSDAALFVSDLQARILEALEEGGGLEVDHALYVFERAPLHLDVEFSVVDELAEGVLLGRDGERGVDGDLVHLRRLDLDDPHQADAGQLRLGREKGALELALLDLEGASEFKDAEPKLVDAGVGAQPLLSGEAGVEADVAIAKSRQLDDVTAQVLDAE